MISVVRDTKVAVAPLLALAAGVLAPGSVAAAQAPGGAPTTFVFERLNGTYADLGARIKEIGDGLFVVHPASEHSRLTLAAHSLELTPLGDGEHRARLWVRFEGEAQVEASVTMAGMPAGGFEDEVEVPLQERRIEARVRVHHRPPDYVITVLEAPPHVRVAIRSRLAGQIVELCEGISRFSLGTDCGELEAALANPRIPLPEAGDEYLLEGEQLTTEERAMLDAYLLAAGSLSRATTDGRSP